VDLRVLFVPCLQPLGVGEVVRTLVGAALLGVVEVVLALVGALLLDSTPSTPLDPAPPLKVPVLLAPGEFHRLPVALTQTALGGAVADAPVVRHA